MTRPLGKVSATVVFGLLFPGAGVLEFWIGDRLNSVAVWEETGIPALIGLSDATAPGVQESDDRANQHT
jgi:hypothetical protein